ncbi:MAG: hypothetical protein J0I96_14030 [Rhodanobacter sp.]|nr:hypothetical protein [Rhodanobacter sp.]
MTERELGRWPTGRAGRLAIVAAAVAVGSALVYPVARGRLADYRADKALAAAVGSIRAGGDPWENFTALQRAERETMDTTGAVAPSEQKRVTEREQRWLEEALGQGNLVAATALFPDPFRKDTPVYAPERFASVRKAAMDRVLTAAEAALGHRGEHAYTDGWVLHAAANIHAAGTDQARNAAQAVQLYEAAYRAGDTLAALGAARLNQELGRPEAAYRWALQCLGPCQTQGFDLSEYQAGLTPKAIEQAQKGAAP